LPNTLQPFPFQWISIEAMPESAILFETTAWEHGSCKLTPNTTTRENHPYNENTPAEETQESITMFETTAREGSCEVTPNTTTTKCLLTMKEHQQVNKLKIRQ